MDRSAALPFDPESEPERYRLHVLKSLNLLDTPPEAEFDALVEIARHIFDCPIALISLVDDHRQWFKARCGMDATETTRDVAFCAHAIGQDALMVVPDATLDPRFAENALVTGPPRLRFYAGIPIRVSLREGDPLAALGTVCVIDTRPRALSEDKAEMLRHIARLAEELIRRRILVNDAVHYVEDHRSAAIQLERQHRQLTQAERIAQIGSWRLTMATQNLEWSDQVFAIHDLPRGPIPPLHATLEFYPPHSRAVISAALGTTMQTGDPFDVEVDFVSKTGRDKRIRSMGEIEFVEGKRVALIGVVQDITVRYHLERALRRSASQDALTGIANRAGFTVAMDAAIGSARAVRAPLALLLVDLDDFKRANDTFGHLAGDMILQEIAQRLQAPYLARCMPARLGGDEFVAIVTDPADCADVEGIAGRLLDALRQPIAIRGGSVTISGTIGIGWLEDGIDCSGLLHRADLALYEAKRAGKGVMRNWSAAITDVVPAKRRASSRGG